MAGRQQPRGGGYSIKYRTVRSICLATLNRWHQRSYTKAVILQVIQLYFETAIYRASCKIVETLPAYPVVT